MKNKLIVLSGALTLFSHQAFSQQQTITGKVMEASTGKPLSGVTIRNNSTKSMTQSDVSGNFSLIVNKNDKLTLAFIGYTTQSLEWSGQSNLNLQLEHDQSSLDEVVVTGYGTTTKKAFTGSATTISNKQFKDLQVSSVTGVLQGNASGVLAVGNSGQPGEDATIRIRGIGSYNASNEPLILVDGAPFNGSLNSINPNDIENITVLKDASATSIYGSRAANGIIQIITKQGKGKAKLDFTLLSGISSRAVKDYKTVNAQQYYELTWEALRNDALVDEKLITTGGYASAEEYATNSVVSKLVYNPFSVDQPIGADGKLVNGATQRWDENWMDEMISNGVRQEYNASISGSDNENRTNYFFGGGYLKDEGIVQGSDFKRYSGRLNLNTKITNWLKAGVSSSLAKSDQNYPYQGTGYASNIIYFARNIAPIYPVHLVDLTSGEFIKDSNGNLIYDFGNNTATLGELRAVNQRRLFNQGQNVAATNSLNPVTYGRMTGNIVGFLDASIWKGLSFKSQYSLNYNTVQNDIFWNPFYGDGTTLNGYAYRSIQNVMSQNFTNSFTYDRNFENHHVNVVAGMEAFKQVTENTSAARSGFTFADPKQVSYGTTSSASGTKEDFRLESYFGRLNYDFGNKYHLSASVRTDGSTRFEKNHRWGTFYAVGASWNLNQENFLKDTQGLSNLKLKGSYGTSGNQALSSSFPYMGTYESGYNIGTASGSVISTVTNEYITWESTRQLDLGLEFGFLKDRITGSLGYFDRRSNNLLFERPLPNSSGVSSVSDNIGGVRNDGWEFELNTSNINKENFKWKTMFNITKLQNKITEVPPGTTWNVGDSWYTYRLKEYAGVDAADGAAMWYMDQEDGTKVTTKKYDDATLYNVGDRLQNFTGGITNFFNYKNLDFSVLASFGIGGEYYDSNYQSLMNGIRATGNNASTDVLNRWQNSTDVGDGLTPKLQTTSASSNSSSTRFLYSHTFMRIRNMTLGYNIPKSVLDRIKLSNVRIYCNVQNPFTFFGSAPQGADPDSGVNAQASNSNSTTNKFVSFGLNIGL